MIMNVFRLAGTGVLFSALAACSVVPPQDFPRAESVDVSRFMGDWYVIAHIPPKVVANSYNNVETYRQVGDDTIQTVYTYREGSFIGSEESMKPVAKVIDGTNGAVWGMQFIWPIKMEYTISYVDPAYQTTIVARSKRDWVWVMARTPQIDDAVLDDLVDRVAALGYDRRKLRFVPQQPLSERDDRPLPPGAFDE